MRLFKSKEKAPEDPSYRRGLTRYNVGYLLDLAQKVKTSHHEAAELIPNAYTSYTEITLANVTSFIDELTAKYEPSLPDLPKTDHQFALERKELLRDGHYYDLWHVAMGSAKGFKYDDGNATQFVIAKGPFDQAYPANEQNNFAGEYLKELYGLPCVYIGEASTDDAKDLMQRLYPANELSQRQLTTGQNILRLIGFMKEIS
jgi:hypothetical protein